jgi:cytochrome c oxidase subunit 1
VTVVADRAAVPEDHPEPERRATGLLAFITSTDHKRIGISYMATAFAFFLIGGALAEVIRAQLWSADNHVVSESTYNQVFTMHGSIMMFLFLGPFAFGLANYFVPLQIGARDMAFPRLNAMSYWFYLFGGLTMLAAFLTASGAADFGWTAYAPLSEITRSPGVGADLWIAAIVLTGLSGVLTGVNIIATVLSMRAPGMTMFRMPIFTWNMVVTSVLVLIAFPVLTSAGAMLFADRHLGAHVFDPGGGGQPILWQHLFWFFGHPEVYILVLPFFGVITEVLPVFSRRPVFGYAGLVFATFAIAALSVGVWAHHMFTTGAVTNSYFSGLSMLIAVPTGVKFFNWIGTMWHGQITFPTPMKFALGFLVTFLIGGISGVLQASAPIDFTAHDTYFVVAHMHYVMFGGSVFALYAGIYYWFPKVTGRKLDEGLGTVHFWMTFVGFHLTFFVQHILGLDGMPRRVASYPLINDWEVLNRISSLGAFLLGASTLPFLWNVWRTLRAKGDQAVAIAAGDDPWEGHTLEWATTSPPPPHNFTGPLPPVRSNRPVWDLHHPDAVVQGHL